MVRVLVLVLPSSDEGEKILPEMFYNPFNVFMINAKQTLCYEIPKCVSPTLPYNSMHNNFAKRCVYFMQICQFLRLNEIIS